MMKNLYRYILVFFVFAGLQLSAADQIEKVVIQKMSKKAELILTGKVIQKQSNWNESKTRIYTKTTLQVDELLKGITNQNTVEVTYLGGEVGDVGELYSHLPRFADNEEVLVFLKKNKNNDAYHVLFGEEGKITIITDEKTNQKVTTSNLPIKDLKSQINSFMSTKIK